MVVYESWELKMAFQIAWQVRGCPPDRLVFANPREAKVTEHLAVCPFCRDSLEDRLDDDAWQQLAERLRSELKTAPPDSIAPGQIRSLRFSLGGWGPKGRYYNPPLVLILGFPPPFKEAVNVAQVYNDPTLAASGDIMLDEALFAESWNTYTLLRDDLEHSIGNVSEEMLREVIEATSEEMPGVVEEPSSPVMAFRRMEIEVGAFFASRAVALLLVTNAFEPRDRILDNFRSPEELKRYFEEQHRLLKWPLKHHNTLETLALAELPADELPLAAAADETLFSLKHAVLRCGKLRLMPAVAEPTVRERQGEALLLGGQVQIEAGEAAVLHAWWSASGERLISPVELHFNPKNGFYRAVFSGIDDTDFARGRLLLLVCEWKG